VDTLCQRCEMKLFLRTPVSGWTGDNGRDVLDDTLS